MAGEIINTCTTVLLVAVNVFVKWLPLDELQPFSIDADIIVYAANLVLFPLVLSGYLAMLFVNSVEYCRRKFHLER